jgi:L,D-transpeptidase ErfK/SrfK
MIIGGETVYTVRQGDTLELIGARLGADWWKIARDNNFDPAQYLRAGQEFKVNTRKIIPTVMQNGIIINIPDRTLYLFKENRLHAAVPVALGKPPEKGKRDWSTPRGKFTILKKAEEPTWLVPESIQKEMGEEGKPVKTIVPPGPDNPLGRYAFKISIPGILIHETIWPRSVYQFRSHGCIRVMPEHMERLFHEVEPDTPGEVIYVPVKVALSDAGRVFLEVHRDVYHEISDMREEVKMRIDKAGLSQKVDWQKAEKVLKKRSGVAEDVTL